MNWLSSAYLPADDAARALARRVLAQARQGALGVILPGPAGSGVGASPYVSRVAVATDEAGMPLLLVSAIALHSRAMAITPAISLLVGAPAGNAVSQAGDGQTRYGHTDAGQTDVGQTGGGHAGGGHAGGGQTGDGQTGDGQTNDGLADPRLTLMGDAEPADGPPGMLAALRHRWLLQHPNAGTYMDLPGFSFVRLRIGRALLNAGFGRAYGLGAADFRA